MAVCVVAPASLTPLAFGVAYAVVPTAITRVAPHKSPKILDLFRMTHLARDYPCHGALPRDQFPAIERFVLRARR
jgi:hypothetical protein